MPGDMLVLFLVTSFVWSGRSGETRLPKVCMIGRFCAPQEDGLADTLLKVISQSLACENLGFVPLVHWDTLDRRKCGAKPVDDELHSHLGNCWFNLFGVSQVQKVAMKSLRDGFCVRNLDFLLYSYLPSQLAGSAPLRSLASSLVARHMSLTPHLASKVEKFRKLYFNGHIIIGIQVGGAEGSLEYGQRSLPLEIYVTKAEEIMKNVTASATVRFFVASNTNGAAEAFRETFGNEVVLTSDTPVISRAGNDAENRHGIECGSSESSWKCAQANADSVVTDIWLLASCDYYVHWRGAIASLPLLINASLRSYEVGPHFTDTDPTTDFVSETRRVSREASFRSLAMTSSQVYEHVRTDISYRKTFSSRMRTCGECDTTLIAYGLRPMSDDSWAYHYETRAMESLEIGDDATSQKALGHILYLLSSSQEATVRWDAAMALASKARELQDDHLVDKCSAVVLHALFRADGNEEASALLHALSSVSRTGDEDKLATLLKNGQFKTLLFEDSLPAALQIVRVLAPPLWCESEIGAATTLLSAKQITVETGHRAEEHGDLLLHLLPGCPASIGEKVRSIIYTKYADESEADWRPPVLEYVVEALRREGSQEL